MLDYIFIETLLSLNHFLFHGPPSPALENWKRTPLKFTPTYFENFCQYLTYNHNLFMKDLLITFAFGIPSETSDVFCPEGHLPEPSRWQYDFAFLSPSIYRCIHPSIHPLTHLPVHPHILTYLINKCHVYISLPGKGSTTATNTDSAFALMRVSSAGYW